MEEADDGAGDELRTLERRQVRSAADRLEPRPADLLGDATRLLAEVLDVELADEHERRRADLAQPAERGRVERAPLGIGLRCVGVELQLERALLHLADERAHARVDIVRLPLGPVDPRPQVELDRGVDVARVEQGVLLLAERLHLVREVPAADRGADQHERGDAIGMREREVERVLAAERGADHGRPPHTLGVEQRDEVVHVRERARLER